MTMIDISKIPKRLRTLLINLILLPYWYISVYIFHPSLYNTGDFLIIISVCIGLTIISSFFSHFVISNGKSHFLEENNVILATALQIILLSSIIFLGYLSKVFFFTHIYSNC